MNFSYSWLILTTCVCLITLPTQAQKPKDAGLHVGIVVDKAGDNVNASRDFFAGVKTSIDSLNERGGVDGRLVRLTVRYADGSPASAEQVAAQLASDDAVDAILGVAGDAAVSAVAASKALEAQAVPIIGLQSGIVAERARNLFFTRPHYGHEVQRTLTHMAQLGATQIAVLYYGGTTEAVKASVKMGINAVKGVEVSELDTLVDPIRHAAQIVNLLKKKPKPQVVLLVGNSLQFSEDYQTLRKLEPGTYVIGLSMVNPRTVLELVPANVMGGAMISQVMVDPMRLSSPLVREFDKAFKRYFDEAPSHQTLEGYVAAQYLIESARRVAGPLTRTSLLKSLQRATRVDVNGFDLSFAPNEQRGSKFVDLVMMRADGSLMQ